MLNIVAGRAGWAQPGPAGRGRRGSAGGAVIAARRQRLLEAQAGKIGLQLRAPGYQTGAPTYILHTYYTYIHSLHEYTVFPDTAVPWLDLILVSSINHVFKHGIIIAAVF